MIGTKVRTALEDLSPILFSKYLDEPQPKTQEGYREQGPRKCHRNDEGDICIPSDMILGTVREAMGDIAPRGKIQSMRKDIMAGLYFDQELYSIGKKEPDGIDVRPVIRGKGAKTTLVLCYRPLVKHWKIEMTMVLLLDLQEQVVRQALELAGVRCGLGSFRPRFGRFAVTKWEVEKE